MLPHLRAMLESFADEHGLDDNSRADLAQLFERALTFDLGVGDESRPAIALPPTSGSGAWAMGKRGTKDEIVPERQRPMSKTVAAVTPYFLAKEEEGSKSTDDDGPTLATDDNDPTLATDDDGPTLATDDDGPTLATDDDGPTLATDDDGPTLATDDDGPTFLARYEDLGFLGEGGMGIVRCVLDRDLNREMALKIIRLEGLDSESDISKFIEEAQITAQLQHPGIVAVHELGRLQDSRFYFTMDRVAGTNLKDLIAEVHWGSSERSEKGRGEVSPIRRLIDVFLRICEAVAYAHSRGVIHRDLKPENVMVGDYGEVLVLDWGLAKVKEHIRRAGRSEGTDGGIEIGVPGTHPFVAPEFFRGQMECLPASDVFSLGVILYEMLDGRRLGEGEPAQQVLLKIMRKRVRRPGRVVENGLDSADIPVTEDKGRAYIPAELQRICMKAIEPFVQNRYSTVDELMADIRGWIEGVKRRAEALEVVEAARALAPQISDLMAQARMYRSQASRMGTKIDKRAPVEDKIEMWRLEDEASRLDGEAQLLEAKAVQMAHGALVHCPGLSEARDMLADHYHARHQEAELGRRPIEAERYEFLLKSYNRRRYDSYLKASGSLTLVTDPPNARVRLFEYVTRDRLLVLKDRGELGLTPLHGEEVPCGSYLLVVEAEGRVPVRYPVLISRGVEWDGIRPGDDKPFPIYLPLPGELDADDIYVPAGFSIMGGDWFENGLPRQRVWQEPFVIRRYPISQQEYVSFLNDLVENGRVEEALRYAPRERRVGNENEDLLYGRNAQGFFFLQQDCDKVLYQPDWPALLLTWPQCVAYCDWLQHRTGLGWRLPSEKEWEKAARGVDGRLYPFGDFYDPMWACSRDSHGGSPLPPSIGDDCFRTDTSPYGGRWFSGGVVEWCQDVFISEWNQADQEKYYEETTSGTRIGEDNELPRVVRGGAWSTMMTSGRLTRRQGLTPSFRDTGIGFRVARSFPSRHSI